MERSSFFSGDAGSHLLMAATALFCQALGWYLIQSSITRLPSHEGSLLLILQPVLATVWGAMIFQEPVNAVQAAGIALATAGVLAYQWKYAPHNAQ